MARIGIDEVGRGCWAGPLLVVAVREIGPLPTGLKDSKKLTKVSRELYKAQLESGCEFGTGWVGPEEIDAMGLTEAMRLAVSRALSQLHAHTDEEIIIDGNYNYCSPEFTNVTCLAKADDTVPVVSAASILAKVMRDTYMTEQAFLYPLYGFDKHVGYGTVAHAAALRQHGITLLHRKSYKPVQKYMNI
jgi:ribonuclease HII